MIPVAVVLQTGKSIALKVMSIGFLLENKDSSVVWRGPKKSGFRYTTLLRKFDSYSVAMISQFLKDVDWGDLDFLIIDTPPGTSDEHMAIAGYFDNPKVSQNLLGTILVTTPQVCLFYICNYAIVPSFPLPSIFRDTHCYLLF